MNQMNQKFGQNYCAEISKQDKKLRLEIEVGN